MESLLHHFVLILRYFLPRRFQVICHICLRFHLLLQHVQALAAILFQDGD